MRAPGAEQLGMYEIVMAACWKCSSYHGIPLRRAGLCGTHLANLTFIQGWVESDGNLNLSLTLDHLAPENCASSGSSLVGLPAGLSPSAHYSRDPRWTSRPEVRRGCTRRSEVRRLCWRRSHIPLEFHDTPELTVA